MIIVIITPYITVLIFRQGKYANIYTMRAGINSVWLSTYSKGRIFLARHKGEFSLSICASHGKEMRWLNAFVLHTYICIRVYTYVYISKMTLILYIPCICIYIRSLIHFWQIAKCGMCKWKMRIFIKLYFICECACAGVVKINNTNWRQNLQQKIECNRNFY